MPKLHVSREFLIVLLSVAVQVPLAIFLGHQYDERSFIDTGYLVSAGLNPYQSHVISIFPNPYLAGVNPIIGYPPLWPLLLGVIYRLTYNIVPNLFLYNFAIKIPVIASNIALAYVTKTAMQRQNMPQKTVQFAWLFLLFNPFTLLTTTAWGEFDTLIALLCVTSLYLLSKDMAGKSMLLLSLSIVLKPISLPLIGLPLLYYIKNWRKTLLYITVFAVIVFALWFLPFYLLGWVLPSHVTTFFNMAGGMTVFNIVEIFQKTATLPAGLEFLGYIWIPALLAGYLVVYRNPPKSFNDMAKYAVVLLLIFFLSRSWLSEQNINLLFPFLLIMLASGKVSSRNFHLVWIVSLVFLVLNMSIPQLFFLAYPPIISARDAFDVQFGAARLVARFSVTVLWWIVAFGILTKLLNQKTIIQQTSAKLNSAFN